MKRYSSKDIAQALQQGQSEQTINSSQLSVEEIEARNDKWASAWRILFGMKLITFDAVDDEGNETRDYHIWKRGLADLSCEEINQGLVKVRDNEGWFDFPKFRKLCGVSAQDLGLPTSREAYNEACLARSPKDRQIYSHPIVYLAGQQTGWFNLRQQHEYKIFSTFEHYYNLYAHRVMRGERFKVQPAITKQDDLVEKITPEQYQAARAKFQQMMKGVYE